YIFPGSQERLKWWWKQFIGWNLFLPVYLFFIYLGLIFLSQRDNVIQAVVQANGGASGVATNNAALFGVSNTLTFNLLFFYIFTAVVMVGAAWAATKVTSELGGT